MRLFLTTASLFTLSIAPALAEPINCYFQENGEKWAAYTTIIGTPGSPPDWIAQSISVQSEFAQILDGLWIGVAKDEEHLRVSEVTVRHYRYGEQDASGVAIVSAPMTSAAFQKWLDNMLGEGMSVVEPMTVWGVLTLDGVERMEGPMETADFGVGLFNQYQLGYHNEPDGDVKYGPQPEAVEVIRALVSASVTATLEIFDVKPEIGEPPVRPPEGTTPLARFTYDPAELSGKLKWGNEIMPEYLRAFAAGCPDNIQ